MKHYKLISLIEFLEEFIKSIRDEDNSTHSAIRIETCMNELIQFIKDERIIK